MQTGEAEMMEEALMMATPAAPNTPRRSQRLAQGTQNTMDENIENADNDVFVSTIYHTIFFLFLLAVVCL